MDEVIRVVNMIIMGIMVNLTIIMVILSIIMDVMVNVIMGVMVNVIMGLFNVIVDED